MLDWLKSINKVYPDFWKNYLSTFNKKSKRYVILATETTGESLHADVILTIGAFSVIDDSIHVGDSFETVLMQYKYFHDNKLPFDFIVESKLKKMGEPDAIRAFIDYLGNAILVGHNINFSVDMINVALERLECGHLKNEALDVNIMHQKLVEITDYDFSLNELLEAYKIPVDENVSSPNLAYKTALLFLKLKSRLGLK
ncbi:exonuclease domain-containing protein [Flavobacterium sp. UMI-01]|uniref:exonuclease domain-containing protein n=1 Tax=Flavobacterium sp. UMI-01 TaxID=1441053 RepID=UPI001C7DCA10|nr:exonuclease domain-containing protein [Flavobacterium sp. UMI-01]GIZ08494.1 DNA polymerase III subunit epsilon [Flavobacterium sp. UMI-01]